MIKQLIKLANHLDKKGLRKEADYLDLVIKRIAESQETLQSDVSGPSHSNAVDEEWEQLNAFYQGVISHDKWKSLTPERRIEYVKSLESSPTLNTKLKLKLPPNKVQKFFINLKNRLLGKKASYNGNKVQYYKDSQNNIYAKDTSEEYMWNGDSWQSGSVPSGSSRLGAIEAMKSNNIPKL